MGFNFGIRINPKHGIRLTKSFSAGRGLIWVRKSKIKGSARVK